MFDWGLYHYWVVIVLMMAGLYVVISKSNLVKKVIGKQVRTEISVPQGVHSVRVRISSPEAGINAADTLRSLFHGGEARVLGVSLDVEDKKLSLYWKG